MSDRSQAPGRPVSASASRLVRWMGIADANSAGSIHGGTVMRFVDEAGALAAIKHCGMRVVTAGMDRMTFLSPVFVGELLSCSASVNAVWRTSMEVGVRVEAERPAVGTVRHTNSAYLTMVAVDDEGRPRSVPPLLVEDGVEERREKAAQTRRRNRLTEREEIVGG